MLYNIPNIGVKSSWIVCFVTSFGSRKGLFKVSNWNLSFFAVKEELKCDFQNSAEMTSENPLLHNINEYLAKTIKISW